MMARHKQTGGYGVLCALAWALRWASRRASHWRVPTRLHFLRFHSP